MIDFNKQLDDLRAKGNFRTIPRQTDGATGSGVIDFSSNDYLGLAGDDGLKERFFEEFKSGLPAMSSSASRLLALDQRANTEFETLLEQLYPGRKALLFNSGYHANTGMISALADRSSLVIADRLVHASIIDGIVLSRTTLQRFRHNDMNQLEEMVREAMTKNYSSVLVVTESVFSMDGDSPDIEALVDLKRRYPSILLYIDEAHAFGVCGPRGLGLAAGSSQPDAFDCVIVTLGKAAASVGAFALISPTLRDVAVNRARSLIFSTALPPINVAWSKHVVEHILHIDDQRKHLHELSAVLNHGLQTLEPAWCNTIKASHIQPLIVGSARAAVEISQALRDDHHLIVLPIRTPTVPAGTERLRISLSAALSVDDVEKLCNALTQNYNQFS